MANPTTLIVPGADFSAAPPLWIIPTSVAPSYVGMFGASQARSLANGAAFGLPPSVPTGEMPAIQPGYMTAQGWNATTGKQAGIALPPAISPGTNYSIFWVSRVSGGVFGNVVPVLLDPTGNPGNLVIDYYAPNNLTFRQRTSSTLINASSPTLVGGGIAWQAFLATAQQGVGCNLYIMTNAANTVVPAADVNPFLTSSQYYVGGGGTGTNATTFQGAGDIAIMIIFPSVLSAADRAAIYVWAKAWCAKNGITI